MLQETSSGTLSSFLLAAVKYGPQFIPKAQYVVLAGLNQGA